MQPKRSPLLLATAALGVLALGGLAYMFIGGGSAPAPPPKTAGAAGAPTPTPIPSARWIAARDIPPRTRLTPDMLAKANVVGAVPAGAITDPKQVEGMLTNDTIPQGETIQLASFTQGIKRAVPANIEVPRGFRAVAIYVDPTSTAASLVDAGDYVDVIAVHKLSWDKQKNQYVVGALQFSTGRLVGSDLKVLAVDKSINAPVPTPTPTPPASNNAPTAPSQDAPSQPAPPPAPTPTPAPAQAGGKIRVVLAAPVDVATRLVAANDQGTLHIVIRNPIDGDQTTAPEAREYPSRVVTVLDPSATGEGSGGPRRPRTSLMDNEPPLPPMPSKAPVPVSGSEVQMGMPSSAPAPLPGIKDGEGLPSPASQPTHDVTIIRGTEKTRAVVPIR